MEKRYRITNPQGVVREDLTKEDVSNFKASKGGVVPEGYILESYDVVVDEETPVEENSATEVNPTTNEGRQNAYGIEAKSFPEEQGMRWHTPKEREQYAGGFARIFPYTTNGVLNGEGPTFDNAINDISTLGSRFLASGPLFGDGNMGYTSMDYANEDNATGLFKGVVTNPVTSGLLSLGPAVSKLIAKLGLNGVGALIANVGGQFNLAAMLEGISEANLSKYLKDSRGNWQKFLDLMKFGAGAGAGEVLNLGLMKGISSYRNAALKNANNVYGPQEEAIANIGMRGKTAYNNMPAADRKKVTSAYRGVTDSQMADGISPKEINATNVNADNELRSIGAMPQPESPVGTGILRKPKSVSVSSVGRELSREEIEWLQKISATREELLQNIKEAQNAKAAGRDLNEVFKDRIAVAQDVGKYREQFVQERTDADVKRKQDEATLFRNMAQSEADAARYAMQPITEDIMRGEQAVADVERQISDIVKRIEELNEKVTKRLEGNFTNETFTSINDVHKKYPQYVTSATQEIDQLEKELAVLQNHLNMEDFVRGVNEYKYSATPKATDAYRASEEFTESANNAEGLISGIKSQGAFDKANAGFRGRNDVETIKRLREEKMAPLVARYDDAKKKVQDTIARLKDMKSSLADAKGTRSHNLENGVRQLRENTASNMPEITTNKLTEDFSKKLLENLENAEVKDNSSFLTKDGYVKRNAQGVIIPPDDTRDVLRARDVAEELYSVVANRAKGKGLGIDVGAEPKILNEDIIYEVQRLVDRNNFSLADAVVQSCDWLSDAEKKSIIENAIKFKMSDNLRKGYKNPKEFQDGQINEWPTLYGLKEGLKKVPGVKAAGKALDIFVPDPRDVTFNDVQKAWNTLHDPKNYRKPGYPGSALPTTGYGLVSGVRGDRK